MQRRAPSRVLAGHPVQPTSRRLLRTVAATVAVAALLIAPSTASANNDPHRSFLASAPFELDQTFCAFSVHVDILVNREYATFTSLADGSTVITVSGSFFVGLTNPDTSKTIVVNASGPGTFTVSPDGMTVILNAQGRGFFFAPNLTDYGFPSNVVAVAGPVVITQQLAGDGTFTFTSVLGHPQVITDVCAALS